MVANVRRPSTLLALVLLLTLTLAQLTIDSRSPSVARGIIGESAQLPCATTSNEQAVSWWRLRDNQVISHKQRIAVDDPRFGVGFNPVDKTWYLNIQDSTKEDEGNYICRVKTLSGRAEKTVRLTMIEPSDTLRWRADLRCGGSVECDPLGAYPCCSAYGWCGFTQLHCDCGSCTDYRQRRPTKAKPTPAVPVLTTDRPTKATPTPAVPVLTTDRPTEATPTPASEKPRCAKGYLEVSTKCLLYADDVMTWSQASQFCASKGGRLITFETLDQLMKVVGNLTTLQIPGTAALSPRVPVWVGVSTQGHKDSNGTLWWRWVMGQSELKDTSLLNHLGKADGECRGFLNRDHPNGTIHHTSDYQELLLSLCEQVDN